MPHSPIHHQRTCALQILFHLRREGQAGDVPHERKGWRFFLFLILLLSACAPSPPSDGPYVEPIAPDRVAVTWTTERPTPSQVEYGFPGSYSTRVVSEDTTRVHRLLLSGLRPGRRYAYRVVSGDSRAEGVFTAGAPFLKGPYSQNVTPSSAVLMWETPPAVESRLAFGPAGTLPDTLRPGAAGGLHETPLPGLRPGTRYRARVFAEGLSSPELSFRTPAATDTAFTFLLYGDSRSNPEVHAALVERMAASPFELILHTGDFVDDGRDLDLWGPQFFDPVRSLALRAPIYPALGNHEEDAPAYYRFFSVPPNGSIDRPEAWYAFDWGIAHFVVLDTNPVSGLLAPGTEQRRFLEQDLAAAKNARWKFAVFHHPLYSSGRYKSDLELRRTLMPLFERSGVDMVLSGHDHLYERTWPQWGNARRDGGIVQVVSGGGGAELYPAGRSDWTAVSKSCTNYCLFHISGSRLDFEAFDGSGNRIDVFTRYKDRAPFEALLAAAAAPDPAGQVEAVRALGRTGRLEAVSRIVPLAESGSLDLRRVVAEALVRIGSPDGLNALLSLSRDNDAKVRQWAVRGLAEAGCPEAATACLARLKDPDPGVRRNAARGLQRTPLPGAVPALVEAARDPDETVRLEAVQALVEAPVTPAAPLVAALSDPRPNVRRVAFDGLVRKDLTAQAVPALVDRVDREAPDLRRDIVRTLGEVNDSRALPALRRSLKDDDPGVRRLAVIALGEMADTGASGALIEVLNDPDPRVRTYATRALRLITGQRIGADPDAWKQWWKRRSPVP